MRGPENLFQFTLYSWLFQYTIARGFVLLSFSFEPVGGVCRIVSVSFLSFRLHQIVSWKTQVLQEGREEEQGGKGGARQQMCAGETKCYSETQSLLVIADIWVPNVGIVKGY